MLHSRKKIDKNGKCYSSISFSSFSLSKDFLKTHQRINENVSNFFKKSQLAVFKLIGRGSKC